MELIEAVENNDLEFVKKLIKNGYPLNDKNEDGWTALIASSFYGHIEIAKELIKAGASLNEENEHAWTALINASFYGHVEIVKELIKAGAILDIKNDYGYTIFDYNKELFLSFDMQDLILSMYPHLVGFLKDNVELHKYIYDKYYKVIDMSDLNIF